MKKIFQRIALAAMCLWLLPGSVFAEELLIPGGQVVGLQLCHDTVTVAAFDDKIGSETNHGTGQRSKQNTRNDGGNGLQ